VVEHFTQESKRHLVKLRRLHQATSGGRRDLRKGGPLSEYTREEMLKLIKENGGPEGLDLRGGQSDQAVVVLYNVIMDGKK